MPQTLPGELYNYRAVSSGAGMARILIIMLVAAVVGGGAVYGAMLYLG